MQIYIDQAMSTQMISQLIDELETDLERPGWQPPQRMGIILATKDEYRKELDRLKDVLIKRISA